MALKNVYLVMDTNGTVIGEQSNVNDALAQAKRAAAKDGGGVYATVEQLDPETSKEKNPPPSVMSAYNLTKLPERIKAAGGEQVTDENGKKFWAATKESVMSLSLDQAHSRLNEWFPIGKKWRSPKDAANGFFAPNTKMRKTATELFGRPPSEGGIGHELKASSYGMSLLPHFVPFRGGVERGPNGSRLTIFAQSPEAIAQHYDAEGDPAKGTWCIGSSEGCRATCLVYSGQNQSADESIIYKHAMSAALLADPIAFLRLMVEGIRMQMNYVGEAERWVRLNVYQDIPWEAVFPDLFLRAGDDKTSGKTGGWIPQLRAYDYTKIANRAFTPNYNLTFSFSGNNLNAAKGELERGRNVAAVFVLRDAQGKVLQGTKASKWVKRPIRARYYEDLYYPLDVSDVFGDVPVLNGDTHDIRPYDALTLSAHGYNGAAVIGLDFKIPRVKVRKGKGGTVPLYDVDKAGKFVTRVLETESGLRLAGEGIAASRIAGEQE